MKKKRWEIIYEDNSVVVIDKPAPFLTIPDRYDKNKPNLLGKLSEKREAIKVNHRLDKDTSGLILFTKTPEAHKHLSDQFEQRTIKKHYLTIVHGVPQEEVGLINLPLAPSGIRNKGMVVDKQGKESLTKYKILEAWRRYSLLEVKLLTGRQHQIRVHMRSIHCPIVCDHMYGDGEPFFLSSIKRRMNRSREEEERPLLNRIGLHSYILGFDHPESGERMQFKAELHKDMRAVVNQLRKTV